MKEGGLASAVLSCDVRFELEREECGRDIIKWRQKICVCFSVPSSAWHVCWPLLAVGSLPIFIPLFLSNFFPFPLASGEWRKHYECRRDIHSVKYSRSFPASLVLPPPLLPYLLSVHHLLALAVSWYSSREPRIIGQVSSFLKRSLKDGKLD